MVTLIRLAETASEQHQRQLVERLHFAGIGVREFGVGLLAVTTHQPVPADLLACSPGIEVVAELAADHPRAAKQAHPTGRSIVEVGNTVFGDGRFVVAAGPCSIESSEQVLATAKAVRESGAHMLRGGLFKPRTSPYGFQGLGAAGYELAHEARAATGLPLVTEVVDVRDLDEVVTIADMIQVGARNMQNFGLLRELGRLDVPVLLKRGIAATIDETLLAAEYILDGGNDRIVLCERGIRSFERSYRFTLDITAIPVLRERTHLPVIVDPSHAAGRTRWVEPLALAAGAVGADGIIVETHNEPDRALCDGKQALPTEELPGLMDRLALALAATERSMHPVPDAVTAPAVPDRPAVVAR